MGSEMCIRDRYYADLVLVDMHAPYTVSKDNILYKCGWSPLEGQNFRSQVTHTIINGSLVYDQGRFSNQKVAMPVEFIR